MFDKSKFLNNYQKWVTLPHKMPIDKSLYKFTEFTLNIIFAVKLRILKIFFCYKNLNSHKQNLLFTGACHAEELQYLFPIGKDLFISAAPTKADTQIRKAITELWVNFAKTR